MSAVVLPLPEPPDDEVLELQDLLESAQYHRGVVLAELLAVREEQPDGCHMVRQFQAVHQEALASTLALWDARIAQHTRRITYLTWRSATPGTAS